MLTKMFNEAHAVPNVLLDHLDQFLQCHLFVIFFLETFCQQCFKIAMMSLFCLVFLFLDEIK